MHSESPYEKSRRIMRDKLQTALALPIPMSEEDVGCEGFFDPWENIIQGIHGNYSSEADDMMIEVLEAVRDGNTFSLIEQKGFAAEFMLYVLSGHGLTEYGTSPRGAWPEHRDLWQLLIDKWKAYREVAWRE
jgi:hypothetical protein